MWKPEGLALRRESRRVTVPDAHEGYNLPRPINHESAEALALTDAAEKLELNRQKERDRADTTRNQ
jgi:hypothetical protein